VKIGLCEATFPDVRRALAAALPSDRVGVLGAGGLGAPVDVLVPLGAAVDATLLDAAEPRLVQQFGVGVQGVDLAAARERRIPVANVPAAGTGNATAVAEVALLHILALLRRYSEAQRSVAAGRIGEPSGTLLAGKTGAVLGLGAVGSAVARLLHAFDVDVLGIGRRAGAADYDLAGTLHGYYHVEDLTAAAAAATLLVVCCPLTEETAGLVDARVLEAMPDGAHLVNVARGGVVEPTALLAALRSGRLAGAGLDVFTAEPVDPNDPLLAENVSVTPHIGGVTHESYAAIAARFAENVARLRAGAAPVNVVG
jgi:phosphoglycerate dehydrogenase-like enzyme